MTRQQNLKIALVAGNSSQLWPLSVFSRLTQSEQVRLHAFEGSVPAIFRDAGIALSLYRHDPEKPGYMGGLETQLAGADVIIAAGSENLASFQALRTALKSGIPFHCLAFETAPHIFDAWANIKAIRHDILSRSNLIWSMDGRTRESLMIEGVDGNSIRSMVFEPERTFFTESARNARFRFRDHVGIHRTSRVLLFQGDHGVDGVAGHLVRAIQHSRGDHDLVVLMATPRENSDPLKYLVANLGLSRHFRFLHQDTSPFLLDLLAASDIWIAPDGLKSSATIQIAKIAAHLGVTVVATLALDPDKSLTGSAIHMPDPSVLSIGRVIKTFLAGEPAAVMPAHSSLATNTPVDAAIPDDSVSAFLAAILQSACPDIASVGDGTGAAPGSSAIDWNRRVVAIESSFQQSNVNDILFETGHLLLLDPPSVEIRSRILALQGDAHQSGGNYEQAGALYRSAIHVLGGFAIGDPSTFAARMSVRCLNSLARIAWKLKSDHEALDLYRRAVALDPSDPVSCTGLGTVYQRLGLHEESLRWLGKSLVNDASGEINYAAVAAFRQAVLACPERELARIAVAEVVSMVGELPALENIMESLR